MTLKKHISYATDRRDFIKASALTGLGVLFSNYGFAHPFGQKAATNTLPVGFTITPIAMLDDATALTLQSDQVHQLIKDYLVSNLALEKPGSNDPQPGNTARLAGVADFNQDHCVALLEEARQNRDKIKEDETLQHHLAFALGWLGYRTAQRHFGDAYEQNDDGLPSEKGIYYDATLLQALSPNRQPVKAEALDSLFLEMIPRILTRFHTLIPDYDDAPGWVIRLATWRDNTEKYFTQLAQAYADPDLAKVKKYVNDFYNQQDPVIQLIRNQSGSVAKAVRNAESQSQYAQAVAATYQDFHTASAFVEGEIEQEALKERLFAA